MTRDDWCRRKTWTKRDQEEFSARILRSRGARGKAQYMRIQAVTLLETGKPDLIAGALELLKRSFADFPDAADAAWAFEAAGQCCEALNRPDDAMPFYQRALGHERKFPGLRSNAAFRLGKLAVEQGLTDLYPEVLQSAEDHSTPAFPAHVYLLNGIRAAVAQYNGNPEEAKALAQLALDAASIRDSGLSHGRGHLGTVQSTDTRFHTILRGLAAL